MPWAAAKRSHSASSIHSSKDSRGKARWNHARASGRVGVGGSDGRPTRSSRATNREKDAVAGSVVCPKPDRGKGGEHAAAGPQSTPTAYGLHAARGQIIHGARAQARRLDDVERRQLANAPAPAAKRRQETTVRIVVSLLSSVGIVPLPRPALE